MTATVTRPSNSERRRSVSSASNGLIDDLAHLRRGYIRDVAQRLESASTREILAWALDEYGDDLLVTTALGAGGVLLLHHLHQLAPDHPAYLIDTGKLFAETHAYRDYLTAAFGFRIETVKPDFTESDFEAAHGPALWDTNPDLCCRLRKVEPAARLKHDKRAWISALRRDQGGLRATLQAAEVDGKGLVKVYPLIHTTRAQIDDQLRDLGILQHPLRAAGYSSLGCVPCTAPGTDGGERTGRWTGTGKTECGLHFDSN